VSPRPYATSRNRLRGYLKQQTSQTSFSPRSVVRTCRRCFAYRYVAVFVRRADKMSAVPEQSCAFIAPLAMCSKQAVPAFRWTPIHSC